MNIKQKYFVITIKFKYNGFNQLIRGEDEKNNITTYNYLSNGLRLSKSVNGRKRNFVLGDNQIMLTVISDELEVFQMLNDLYKRGYIKN